MNLSRVDLNLLVVLEAIYSQGGITRAAEVLNLSQPAVSHALGRLRELFDDPLFIRAGHSMVPTPLTRSLIEPLRNSLRSMEAMLNESKRFDPATAHKRFTIGCRDVLESTILPSLMCDLERHAPGLEVAAVHFNRREAVADLFSGRLDAVVDVILPTSRDIRQLPVMREELAVVVRNGHPVAEEELTLDSYLAQRHVLVTSRRVGQGVVDVELARRGLHRQVSLRCQHYYAAWRVVRETDLLLTMPGRLASFIETDPDYQVLPLPLDISPQEVFLYWHENMHSDPANRWLRERLVRIFQAADLGPEHNDRE